MRITIKEFNLCSTFSRERTLLTYAGLYPRRNQNYEYLYHLSISLILVISFSQLFTMLAQLYFDSNNLFKLTETLLYFCTFSTYLFKLLNFLMYRKMTVKIEDFLTEPIFYGFSLQQMKMIKAKIRSCDFIANIFRGGCAAGTLFYCLVPFVDSTQKGCLPLPGWFPYDIRKYYVATFILQTISICIGAYCNTAFDILTWKFVSLASAQFAILKENLRSIDFEKSTQETRQLLIKCIQHHINIVELNRQVQKTFSVGMFLQLFCSCGVICTTGFQMVLISIPSIQFLFSLSYLCSMICQIAGYCWYGHDLMTTSDEVGRFLYMSNWYMCSGEIRTILLVLLENLKQPTLIKAGNFVTLSLSTLTQILRTAYSYFALLKRLYNNN